jgi:hypothetical protein
MAIGNRAFQRLGLGRGYLLTAVAFDQDVPRFNAKRPPAPGSTGHLSRTARRLPEQSVHDADSM